MVAMLKHPRGYRPYVPPGELLLGTMNGTVLLFSVLTILPNVAMTGSPWSEGDHPPTPDHWALIGLALLVSCVVCGGWAYWARRNIERLLSSVPAWLFSVIALLLMVSQLLVIRYWFVNFFSD
jgi:hypothetical protein